ncbi:hypothetical protein RchiOBHm_Chr4g0421911 [Rosa chinensis]|uniref:Uncharacterized protein n=1 Tax=Rosa chinensis TaxID=74649 RepID=A0A2P6QY82_ROSCH|nr:hypothetical protein RchiOBHm_Chr4g0421911 [Rosa chinensis]
MTKLEKQVQETKNRRNDSKEQTVGNSNRIVDENANSDKSKITSETILGLGTVILKHGSKFEKQIEEANEKSRGDCETPRKNSERNKTSSETIHSLESMLIKHSSKLDKEFEEAKKNFVGTSAIDLNKNAAENMKKNASATETNKKAGTKGAQGSLDKIMLNNVHRLEREKMQALPKGNNYEFRTVDKKKGGNNVTLKEIDTLLRQGTWQLPCTPHERPLLNCRQAYCSMELCQALPLIPPG